MSARRARRQRRWFASKLVELKALVVARNRTQANWRMRGAQARGKLLGTAAQKNLKHVVRAVKIKYIADELEATSKGHKGFWAAAQAINGGGKPQSEVWSSFWFLASDGNVCITQQQNTDMAAAHSTKVLKTERSTPPTRLPLLTRWRSGRCDPALTSPSYWLK